MNRAVGDPDYGRTRVDDVARSTGRRVWHFFVGLLALIGLCTVGFFIALGLFFHHIAVH